MPSAVTNVGPGRSLLEDKTQAFRCCAERLLRCPGCWEAARIASVERWSAPWPQRRESHGYGSPAELTTLAMIPERRGAGNGMGNPPANDWSVSCQLELTTARTCWPALLPPPLGLKLFDDGAPGAVVVAAMPVASEACPCATVAYRLTILPPAPQALLAPVTQVLPGLGTSKRHGSPRGCSPTRVER